MWIMSNISEYLRSDLSAFSAHLGDERPNNWHHVEWYKLFCDNSIRKLLLLGPRGHAKTNCAIKYISWVIGNNPDVRILVVSRTHDLSKKILSAVTTTLESDKYRSIFPNIIPDDRTWNKEEILVRRSKVMKDPTLSTSGVLGEVVGKRADLIFCDDIISQEEVLSSVMRERVAIFYDKELGNCLVPDGLIRVLGTRWSFNDLYSVLMEKPGYTVKIYKAIQDDGSALWGDVWTLERLMDKKDDVKSAVFASQYMNEPISQEDAIFKEDWLDNCYYVDLPSNLLYYQAVDPAISATPRADYTAIVTIGVDEKGNIYVVDIYRDRIEFPKQVEKIISKYEQFNPAVVGIESVAYQKALHQQLSAMTNLPVKEVKHGKTDKNARMLSLSTFFENGKIKIKRGFDSLIDEYLVYPKGRTDDVLDALQMAVEISSNRKTIKPWASTSFRLY